MATNPTIQLKRKTGGSGAPASLSAGEPAFNTTQNFLYVGNGSAVKWVGAEILDSSTSTFTSDTQLATRKAVGDNFLLRTTVSSLTLGGGAQVRFTETGGGTDYVALQAPAAVSTSNVIYTLPGAYPGSAGYVLQADTSGNMTWAAPTSSANVGVTATSTSSLFKMLFTDVNATNTSAALFIDTTSGVRFNPSTNELSNEGGIIAYGNLSALGGGLSVYNSSNASIISVGALEAAGHSFRIASTEDDDIFVSQTVTNDNPGLFNSSTMTIGNGYYTTYNVFPIDNAYWANDENPGAATINIGSGGSLAQTYSGFGITKSINIGAGTGAGNETQITLGSSTGSTLINLGAPGPMSSILAYGNLTISGNVTILGGTITANTTSFNLLNTTVTNANVLGAANTIILGGTGGTATIRNAATNLNGTLTVTGVSVHQGAGHFNSTLTVTSTSTLIGDVTASGDIAVNGGDITSTATTFNLLNTTVTNANVLGAADTVVIGSANGTATIRNAATRINGTLTVTGATVLQGAASFNSTLTVTGATVLQGAASFNSTLTVTGATVIQGAASFNSTLTVTGVSVHQGAGAFNSTLSVTGTSTLIGDVTASGDIAVNGGDITSTATTFNFLNTTVTNANVLGAADTVVIGSANGTATIRNAATRFNGTLTVTGATVLQGAASFNSTLTVTGATVVQGALSTNGALSVTGTSTLIGASTLQGAVNMNSTLTVTGVSVHQGAGAFNSTLSVTGTSTLIGDVTASGDIAVNGGDITSTATTFNLLNTTVTNANVLGAANTINFGSSVATISLGTGTTGANVYVKGNLFVQGATTTISSTTVSIADLNITLADGQSTTAGVNGAGITLGSTGITWQYNNTGTNWESTENISIATGKTFKINNSSVLSSTVLGSSVTSASGIVQVGTIGLGTWQGTTIGVAYGGTGLTTYTTGAVVYATAATTLANLAPVSTSGAVLSSTGLNSNPEYKTITLSYGTVTSASNSLSFTIQNAAADGTTKGVATFNSTQFDDASGVITLDTIDGGTYA